MPNSVRVLNWWLRERAADFQLIGFAKISPDFGYLGLKCGESYTMPLYVFKCGIGWGDRDQTTAKFPLVLYAKGTDDEQRYMLLGNKEAALEYGTKLIQSGVPIDFDVDEYNGRKWQYQN